MAQTARRRGNSVCGVDGRKRTASGELQGTARRQGSAFGRAGNRPHLSANRRRRKKNVQVGQGLGARSKNQQPSKTCFRLTSSDKKRGGGVLRRSGGKNAEIRGRTNCQRGALPRRRFRRLLFQKTPDLRRTRNGNCNNQKLGRQSVGIFLSEKRNRLDFRSAAWYGGVSRVGKSGFGFGKARYACF